VALSIFVIVTPSIPVLETDPEPSQTGQGAVIKAVASNRGTMPKKARTFF
jgi:hypothetical protein